MQTIMMVRDADHMMVHATAFINHMKTKSFCCYDCDNVNLRHCVMAKNLTCH